MTIDMRKLHEASYEEIESYCQQLVWQGLANQGQPNTSPSNLSAAVRSIIDMTAKWVVAKEEEKKK